MAVKEIRLPDVLHDVDDALEIENEDLEGLSPVGLVIEIVRTAHVLLDNPRGHVHRPMGTGSPWSYSAREWADERITICLALLLEALPSASRPAISQPAKKKAKAWVT